jgi:nicotinic acid mononucleotide adenylyltransferase
LLISNLPFLVRSPDSDVDPSRVAVGTASLIDHLRGAHPDLDFHFCLGEDSFLDLVGGKWKESDRVLESLRNRLWVVQRSTSSIAIGDDGPGSDGDGGIKGRSSSSDGSLSLALRRAVESAGARLLPVPGATAVSSSRVRACPDLDDDTRARNLVPSQVLQYMRAHRLYSFGER